MSGGESSQNRRSMSSKINYGRNTMDSSGFEGNLRCERKGGRGVEESSWRWVRRGVAEGYCGEEREARAEGFTEARCGKTEGACGGAGGGESFGERAKFYNPSTIRSRCSGSRNRRGVVDTGARRTSGPARRDARSMAGASPTKCRSWARAQAGDGGPAAAGRGAALPAVPAGELPAQQHADGAAAAAGQAEPRRPRRAVRSSRSFPPTAPTSAPRTTPGASGRPR